MQDHFIPSVNRLQSLLEPQKAVRPASPDEVRALGEFLGYEVPAELRRWLSLCNGICIGARCLLGASTSNKRLSIQQTMNDTWPRRTWIPVAIDDFGNYYCIISDYANGGVRPIGYVAGTSGDAVEFVAASSLDKFISTFIETIRTDGEWPSDKKLLLEADPGLASIQGFPLPWE